MLPYVLSHSQTCRPEVFMSLRLDLISEDGMGLDGMGWDGTRQDWMRRDGMGLDETGWDGTRQDWMGWDGGSHGSLKCSAIFRFSPCWKDKPGRCLTILFTAWIFFLLFPSRTGVWQEVQPHVALHRGAELRQLRDARNKALHLLLSGSGGHPALQIRLKTLPSSHNFWA